LNAKRQDPNAALRAQLAVLQTQAQTTQDEFKKLQHSLVPAQEISSWLGSVMQAQRGLQLTGLRTLPVTSVTELLAPKLTADAASPAAPSSTASSPNSSSQTAAGKDSRDAWLYRHGVEITLSGSYSDLHAYLNALEQLPRRVYWGELKINAQAHPAIVMTLTVYTISLEKTWWVI
jgi:MSHA biogenesis protein MshJ